MIHNNRNNFRLKVIDLLVQQGILEKYELLEF